MRPPQTGVFGEVQQMRPPHNGVFWGVQKNPVRSGWDRSGPGGLTCEIHLHKKSEFEVSERHVDS